MYVNSRSTFTYTIQPNDTLKSIASRFQTTPNAIIALNPGLNSFYLIVGQKIIIPYGILTPISGITNSQRLAAKRFSKAEVDLKSDMRGLWEQHVAWTRMTIISIAASLPDEDLVTKRLLRNATDMGNALKTFYGDKKAAKFSNLIRDHLVIAAELVKAAKAGDTKAAADAEKRWFMNADEIADFLHSINPYWSVEAFKSMLHEHLVLTKSEAVYRLSKDYASDIAIYDKIENQALEMSDALTEGIVKQFPASF